jgi:uncharacterized protein (TIGR02594 family)
MPNHILENKIYNVRPGDTLTAIARTAKIKYQDLLALNPQITNPNLIFPGDQIILPMAVSREELIKATAKEVFPGAEPDWLKIARHEIGTSEKSGSANNPRILEYLATTTLPAKDKGQDSTAWCSAFANWCIVMAGEKGTNSAWALDWEKWGDGIKDPQVGAIVVFSRTSASVSGGHVGFFLSDRGSSVEIIGGNQGDSVTITTFPKNGKKGSFHYKLRAYRQPK